jgi:hypothetical protein
VDATDPDLIEELMAFCRAEADENEYQAKQKARRNGS